MSGNTLSKKGSGKPGKAPLPGKNRGVMIVLAGFTAIAIVVIALIAILSTTGGESAENFTANTDGLLEVGTQAPDFTAETVDGGDVSVGGGQGEPTLLAFFWSDCPACNEEAPAISDLQSQYEDLRVVMVGIDSRDTQETVSEFVNDYDIQGPAVYDPSLGSDYSVSAYPTNYFIAGNGEIVAAHTGLAPHETMEGWAEEALSS